MQLVSCNIIGADEPTEEAKPFADWNSYAFCVFRG
jgi:hypothetical protein